jgi:hypothetical protein
MGVVVRSLEQVTFDELFIAFHSAFADFYPLWQNTTEAFRRNPETF